MFFSLLVSLLLLSRWLVSVVSRSPCVLVRWLWRRWRDRGVCCRGSIGFRTADLVRWRCWCCCFPGTIASLLPAGVDCGGPGAAKPPTGRRRGRTAGRGEAEGQAADRRGGRADAARKGRDVPTASPRKINAATANEYHSLSANQCASEPSDYAEEQAAPSLRGTRSDERGGARRAVNTSSRAAAGGEPVRASRVHP